jgi:hypothetical protein
MALPKIDTPVYELDLPLSKKHVRFRPFLVKEQKNLLMAMESDDKETIENNIRQVLHNCTVTNDVNIDDLPILDVEYYFLNLRARSIGEVVNSKYKCGNVVDGKECGASMESEINLLEIKVHMPDGIDDLIPLTNKISVKLKYPEYSVIKEVNKLEKATDIAFNMIVRSIEYIFDGEQYYYAKESTFEELQEFIYSLNQEQFSKIEAFFDNLPKMTKNIDMTCKKCGFEHHIEVEGLEDFFV